MSKCCIIKNNTPELRQRLEQAGISVCICSSFKEADWLCCWESNMAFDVHGVYPDEVDDLTGGNLSGAVSQGSESDCMRIGR